MIPARKGFPPISEHCIGPEFFDVQVDFEYTPPTFSD